MALPGVETAVGILVGLGVLIGFARRSVPFFYRFYQMPGTVKDIQEKQGEMRKQMEQQHTRVENHIGNAQAGIRAVAHKVERNGSTEIDLEQMDDDFIRGKARVRDYIKNDDEVKP